MIFRSVSLPIPSCKRKDVPPLERSWTSLDYEGNNTSMDRQIVRLVLSCYHIAYSEVHIAVQALEVRTDSLVSYN